MEINLTYKGYSQIKDRDLEDIAKSFNGSKAGSGFMIPTQERDISFNFPSQEDADKFVAFVTRKWKDIKVTF